MVPPHRLAVPVAIESNSYRVPFPLIPMVREALIEPVSAFRCLRQIKVWSRPKNQQCRIHSDCWVQGAARRLCLVGDRFYDRRLIIENVMELHYVVHGQQLLFRSHGVSLFKTHECSAFMKPSNFSLLSEFTRVFLDRDFLTI
uniref:Isoaspartyl peptidase/L-asparaginase 1 n=1 Tax=Anthurium amnicola TaxID=1678845 RepID=A0A1D1Y0F0_9ARAE